MILDRSTPPPITHIKDAKLDVPEPITLSNGCKMWIAGNGEEEINKLTIYMTGGGFHETCPVQATACSMAVFNGNKNKTYSEIAEAIDYYGAWRAMQVFDNCTAFSISSLNENFDKVLPIFIDCLRFPTFPDAEFDLNKRQLSVNLATVREQVKYIANKEIARLYYGDKHPLATNPTPANVDALTQGDMKLFFNNYYKSQNCNIVLAGNISDREIAIVDKTLSQWIPNGKPAPILEPAPCPSDEMLKVAHKEGAVQSAIMMMIKAVPRRHPDYFPLRLLVTVLGGYFGSRLMTNIREEKGYTYGINASLSGRSFDGYVGISTECDTQHTWKVIEETKKELVRLMEEPIPTQELETVKRHVMSDLVKTLDTPYNIANYLGNMFCYGTYPTYFNEQVEYITGATSEQLLDVAQRYLDPERLRIVIACDKNVLEKVSYNG